MCILNVINSHAQPDIHTAGQDFIQFELQVQSTDRILYSLPQRSNPIFMYTFMLTNLYIKPNCEIKHVSKYYNDFTYWQKTAYSVNQVNILVV